MKNSDARDLLTMVIMILEKDYDDAEIHTMFDEALESLDGEEDEPECGCR